MNAHHFTLERLCRFVLASAFFLWTPISFSQQKLNLPQMPGLPQIPEFLVPGNGQGFAGIATYYMSQPVIYYDSVWIKNLGGLGSPAFRFLRAHEYAHHARGHMLITLNSPSQMWPVLQYNEELDADCVAKNYLKSIGDFSAIKAGFDVYVSVLPPQDAGGRPGAAARVKNMNMC